MSIIIKILLIICISLTAYAIYADLDRKCYFCGDISKQKLLYKPVAWFEKAFEPYFDDVHVKHNNLVDFAIYPDSYSGITFIMPANSIENGQVVDYQLLYSVVNLFKISEHIYPFYIEKLKAQINPDLNFLMRLFIGGPTQNSLDKKNQEFYTVVHVWNLENSLDYLYNDCRGMQIELLFDQNNLEEINIEPDELTEAVKEFFKEYASPQMSSISLSIAIVENFNEYEMDDLINPIYSRIPHDKQLVWIIRDGQFEWR